MLKARRQWDTVAICEEVLSETVDLVPERLVLEVPFEKQPVSTTQLAPLYGRGRESVEERLNLVLWAGASFFLLGRAYSYIEDHAEAITHFTRYIASLLLKFWCIAFLGHVLLCSFVSWSFP